MITSEGSAGTLNFLFRDNDGTRYIATAGHLLADEETNVWPAGAGPTAETDDGTVIGRAIFAADFDARDIDFALIKVRFGVKTSAAVCHWGGPTGINNDRATEPTVLRMYGNGMAIREVTRERTLLAPRMTHPTMVGALGVVAPGDSGSPVISDDGRAVGIQYLLGVVWGGLPNDDRFAPGDVAIARLRPQIMAAERAIDLRLHLVTAPRTTA